nr:protein POLYCHOME-like [Ipomoea trifida]
MDEMFSRPITLADDPRPRLAIKGDLLIGVPTPPAAAALPAPTAPVSPLAPPERASDAEIIHVISNKMNDSTRVHLERPPSVDKLPKILNVQDWEFLTPEKKLILNSIDTVGRVFKEELQRTPSAKKAEKEKKVKTLMSCPCVD